MKQRRRRRRRRWAASPVRRDRPAWCILIEPGRFLGVDWFDPAPLPVHLRAYRCAAFPSRAMARAALPAVRRSWPRARVARMMGYWHETLIRAKPKRT